MGKSVVLKDFYKDYKAKIEEGSIYDVSYSEYVKIITDIHKSIMDEVVLEGSSVRLLCGVGCFYITKTKINYEKKGKMPTDFKTSKELHKRILNFNEHTNGFIYKFGWSTDKKYKKYHRMYRFEAVRKKKRELASILKEGKRDYIEQRYASI